MRPRCHCALQISACRICKERFFDNHTKKPITPPPQIMNIPFQTKSFFWGGKFPPTPHQQPGGAPRKGRHQFSFIVALLVIMCFTAEETSVARNKRVLPPPNLIGWPHQTTAAVSVEKKKRKKAWCPTWWEIVDTILFHCDWCPFYFA